MKRFFMLAAVLLLMLVHVPAYAGEITFSSGSGDKVSIMKDMRVDKKTSGDAVVIMGNLHITDDVDGDVVAVMGDITVDAKVSGDIVAVFGRIKLTSRADAGGDVISVGNLEKADGAQIRGQEVAVNVGFLSHANALFITLASIFAFFALITGLIAVNAAKQRFLNIYIGMEHDFGRKLVLGFLVYIACTIFFPLLSITVVAPLLYLILLLVAEVVTSVYLGKLVIRRVNPGFNMHLEFITGLALITLIKLLLLILLPRIGFIPGGILYILTGLFINSLGMGILLDTKFGADNFNKK